MNLDKQNLLAVAGRLLYMRNVKIETPQICFDYVLGPEQRDDVELSERVLRLAAQACDGFEVWKLANEEDLASLSIRNQEVSIWGAGCVAGALGAQVKIAELEAERERYYQQSLMSDADRDKAITQCNAALGEVKRCWRFLSNACSLSASLHLTDRPAAVVAMLKAREKED